MKEIRASVFSDAGVTDPKEPRNEEVKDISKEVRKIRILIRESNYLENPFMFCKHTDITKSIDLSERLVNFTDLAEKNCVTYVRSILKGEEYKSNVIFTTKEEQEKSE